MTINQAQDEYITCFNELNEWFSQYEYLLEVASSMDSLKKEQKNKQTHMRGCQSNTWLFYKYDKKHLFFYVDSESLIVKGILGIITDILSGRTPKDVLEADLYILNYSAIKENLSSARNSGIISILNEIKGIASDCYDT